MAFKGKSVTVVVLSAGKGRRMEAGINKMYLEINGIPLLYRTLIQFDQIDLIDSIILISHPQEREQIKSMLSSFGTITKLKAIIDGGSERADSVRFGLKEVLNQEVPGIVMTHDGARPFFSRELVNRLLENVADNEIVIPVLQVFETVRSLENDGRTFVLDRNRIYFTQTPQVFMTHMILPCFFPSTTKVKNWTDEASYFESAGKKVRFVEGEKWNIKLTTPEDLIWAEYLLQRYTQFQIARREV
jgi:2-C-methyl-D-erythritol 4-phosphate cytidylyltransferase